MSNHKLILAEFFIKWTFYVNIQYVRTPQITLVIKRNSFSMFNIHTNTLRFNSLILQSNAWLTQGTVEFLLKKIKFKFKKNFGSPNQFITGTCSLRMISVPCLVVSSFWTKRQNRPDNLVNWKKTRSNREILRWVSHQLMQSIVSQLFTVRSYAVASVGPFGAGSVQWVSHCRIRCLRLSQTGVVVKRLSQNVNRDNDRRRWRKEIELRRSFYDSRHNRTNVAAAALLPTTTTTTTQ